MTSLDQVDDATPDCAPAGFGIEDPNDGPVGRQRRGQGIQPSRVMLAISETYLHCSAANGSFGSNDQNLWMALGLVT